MATSLSLDRRSLLRVAGVGLCCGVGLPEVARPGQASGLWLERYAPGEIKTLMPTPSTPAGTRRIQPAPRGMHARAPARPADAWRVPLTQPPTAYVLTAHAQRVPPWLLYGVALQESQLAFGRALVPYPWTLCVRGRGERHRSYEAVRDALRRYLQAGVTNVDCGAMQVNWHWHSDKLRSVDQALDPYPNLAVGAGILRGHFLATGQWRTALGLYHTGSLDTDDRRARARSYAMGVQRRLAAHGLSLDAVLAVDDRAGAPHA